MFAPGIPQVWYLDLFAGKNDYAAADRGDTGGHKEINRTPLGTADIEQGLGRIVVQDQLQLIRLRNNSEAFHGDLEIAETEEHRLALAWRNGPWRARLEANLRDLSFTVTHVDGDGTESLQSYD